MNKKINSIFSIIGFMTEIFYLINALGDSQKVCC